MFLVWENNLKANLDSTPSAQRPFNVIARPGFSLGPQAVISDSDVIHVMKKEWLTTELQAWRKQ